MRNCRGMHHVVLNPLTKSLPMAKSSGYFGLRRGSTKSHTFSVLNGKQITKDRVEGGNNLSQANSDGSGAKVAERANAGGYDKSFAYSFDASGRMSTH